MPKNAGSKSSLENEYLGNQLFRFLPPETIENLRKSVEYVHVSAGANLFEPGDRIAHALFPLTPAIIGLAVPMQDGTAIEAVAIGREGVVGGLINPGLAPAFARATVRVPGTVVRIPSSSLDIATRSSPDSISTFARYALCFTGELLQSVGCAAMHSLEARCARWLLMTHDRLNRSDFSLTQEALAEMFGVSRTYMTRIASVLQDRGAISYRRGTIKIIDRSILQQASCECYGLIRQHFEAVMPGLYPRTEQ